MSNDELVALASKEIKALGLVDPEVKIEDGTVIRQFKAYPVYDDEYRRNVDIIQEYIQTFKNLQTVGRNGMHRYNNSDHSMRLAYWQLKISWVRITIFGMLTLSVPIMKNLPTAKMPIKT